MNIKKIFNKELIILLFFFAIFIFIRTINFSHFFTFVYDDAGLSTSALEIFRDKKLQLIGPSISIKFAGREIFQGGVIYYFYLFFLLLGHFDPKVSIFLFVIFSGLMIIPLYYGLKHLFDKKIAIFITMLYSLFPFYIHSTMSLWSPHQQFALVPFLIYAMGQFKQKKTKLPFLLIAFIAGFLLQFHFQFVLIIVGLLIYYFLFKKYNIYYLLLFLLGLLLGFFPMVLFELRNNFYNTNTIILFLMHLKEIFGKNGSVSINNYYFLSTSIFLFIIIGSIFRKILNKKILTCFFIILLFWSTMVFVIFPPANTVVKDWTYKDELKVYSIIKNNSAKNYNISSFYDAKAITQKYFLKRDFINIDFENYKTNKYLYVIYYKNKDFKLNIAYEMNTFKPSKILKVWKINDIYNLILSERT